MSATENVQVMSEVFKAIERRDLGRLQELWHPDVEFHWPPSLPYGGVSHRPRDERNSWAQTWIPLQPTEAERRMDPRIVAATEEEVVVLWRQRGISQSGARFDGPVLALYQVRDGKLARAQMFYFDTTAVAGFLAYAADQAVPPN